jgi:hypothetical protein
MENEEKNDSSEIANNTDSQKEKKKYFRVEKNKVRTQEKELKKIFKTQKEYEPSKRKILKELKRVKLGKNNKFITITNKNNDSNNSNDNDSFVVKKLAPKRLKIIKDNKKEMKSHFSKSNNDMIFNDNSIFSHGIFTPEKNCISLNEQIENSSYKIKLMIVYFYSIKNLCKYINKNFFNNNLIEHDAIDGYLNQIYQNLQILDRKIVDFKLFENVKDGIKAYKDDFNDISSLKTNLLFMQNKLNNSMSQNLVNIYKDIDNFCRIYSA